MVSNFLVKIISAIFDLYGKGVRDSQKKGGGKGWGIGNSLTFPYPLPPPSILTLHQTWLIEFNEHELIILTYPNKTPALQTDIFIFH